MDTTRRANSWVFRCAIGGLLACALPSAAAAQPLTVAWDANPESNIAGYKLSYGTQSGNYTTTLDLGNKTMWKLNGLIPNQPYYFVVRAYNTDGASSPNSAEVMGRSTIASGLTADFNN